MAKYIIVDGTDCVNKFALLSSGDVMGAGVLCAYWMTVMVFYNWYSLKFSSLFVLCISFTSPVSFLKIADQLSIASFLPHNS